MKKTVLVTGIGGNVGQGVLRNIRALKQDIHVVGCNIDTITAGNHLCDKVYKVKYAYENGYIEEIREICRKESVDLVIPTTDFEALYLSKGKDALPAVATNDFQTNETFTDKYLTWKKFSEENIPFAPSVLPSAYKDQFGSTVLKPRKGRGSRGVILNPPSVKGFSDDEYMIQEMLNGIEITCAFYVTRENKNIGKITFDRNLANGTTSLCKTTHDYDEQLDVIISAMIKLFEIRGACNIQAIVSDNKVVPFEINGRISGTNSIRAQLGFNDVKFTLDEYLFHNALESPVISNGVAVRMLVDVIYPDASEYDVIENCSTNYIIF